MNTTHGRRTRRRQRGQGMTEYIIIVALIAIGTIAVVTVFGDNLRALFGSSAQALAGGSGTIKGTTDINEEEKIKKRLGNFAEELDSE